MMKMPPIDHTPVSSRLRIAAAITILWCIIFSALSSSAAERFQLATHTYNTAEDGEITRYLLFTETNKFSFMPPAPDWTVGANAADKRVVFTSPDGAMTIAMRMAATNSALQPQVEMDLLRKQAVAHFPEAHIAQEFISYTGSGPGQTFDLQWQSGPASFSARLTFISFSGGTIECSMAASLEDFKKNESPFARILASLQAETLTPKK